MIVNSGNELEPKLLKYRNALNRTIGTLWLSRSLGS